MQGMTAAADDERFSEASLQRYVGNYPHTAPASGARAEYHSAQRRKKPPSLCTSCIESTLARLRDCLYSNRRVSIFECFLSERF
jgi:hypothetical protein